MTHQLQCAIPYFTGLPEDVVTNVWHFDFEGVGDPTGGDLTDLANIVAGFYEAVFLDTGDITMAPWMRPALTRMKIYDLADTPPRVPQFDEIVPLTVEQDTGVQSTTPETAVVLSIHGAITSGVNMARRRGRLYIGGLGAWGEGGTTTSFPAPHDLLVDALVGAAVNVRDNVSDWTWVVYSRMNAGSVPVIGGWIDNAPDTQRRRGQAATARTPWPNPA